MEFLFLLYFPLLVISIAGLPTFQNGKQSQCGYASCPTVSSDPNVLNVHLVPHSHDDVGWLKTVDQYYYGSKNNIQKAGVQYILDSVIQALLKNPNRRFIYVETAFFWKWWQEQPEEIRDQVRHLVENGQLEITGGAWSMNDEAAVHYHSTIDQFTWGFRKLNETLGVCARPRIGWQIDPFGHSREMASLFSQFGFDGFFFARLDWRDKAERLKTKTAEMIWQGSPNLGASSQIFTSVLYNHYSAPPGFCFDVLCNDAPIVDNEKSPEYNAEDRARTFVNFVKSQGTYYRTNNVIVTMGDDFNYQDALSYFTNLDRLIEAINKLNTNVSVFYSTPACYVKAVNDAHEEMPTKTDDFFPYASDHHSYWNGYFTSRPTSKRFERLANNILQVAKQLSVLTGPADSENSLDAMREAVGIMQHHDAITGTEKQHVADDYARIVSEAFETTGENIQSNLRKLYGQESDFQSCLQLNISECSLTEDKDSFYITVYNPLSRPVSHYVRVPVTRELYVVSHNGETIESQIVPIFERIEKAPGRNSKAEQELVFLAESLPPLGFKLYKVELTNTRQNKIEKDKDKSIVLNFDRSGKLKSLVSNEKEISVLQDYLYYPGAVGNNAEFKNRSSGAYIFRPAAGTEQAIPVSKNVQTSTYTGPLVTEYHQKFNSWVGQVIRVYKNVDFVEFNWIVGPIPVNDQTGKEIISRFTTDLKTNKVFYTDSNGRDMIKRIRGVRESFNLTHEEPIAENYCPVTTKITIKEESTKRQVSVLNDRAQGGASLNDGEIELMVHRRLLHDDAFGVGEALNEIAYGDGLVATGKHYLITGQDTDESSVTAREKDLAPRLLMEPWIFISSDSEKAPTKIEFSGIKNALPNNVQILTLEPWGANTVLLRLEHIFEKGEDLNLSAPVSVDISDLFSTFQVLDVEEMNLGANQLQSEVNRLQWKSEFGAEDNKSQTLDGMIVTLNPMEIKTFILKIQPTYV